MARINVKYPCGSKVSCYGVEGMVTAVFIRGRGRAYEFSYVGRDGDLKNVTTEEIELSKTEASPLGFKKVWEE